LAYLRRQFYRRLKSSSQRPNGSRIAGCRTQYVSVLPNRADQAVHLNVAAGGGREQVPLPAKNQALVLALDQGELRRQLNVDHQADASIQLEKGCGCLSGENLPKDGDILLAKLS
jgi:hypothetical protein